MENEKTHGSDLVSSFKCYHVNERRVPFGSVKRTQDSNIYTSYKIVV